MDRPGWLDTRPHGLDLLDSFPVQIEEDQVVPHVHPRLAVPTFPGCLEALEKDPFGFERALLYVKFVPTVVYPSPCKKRVPLQDTLVEAISVSKVADEAKCLESEG